MYMFITVGTSSLETNHVQRMKWGIPNLKYIYIINNNIDVNNMIHFKENEQRKAQISD